jgi:hypothetical protein
MAVARKSRLKPSRAAQAELRHRKRFRRKWTRRISAALNEINADGTERLEGISDEDWAAAVEAESPESVESPGSGLSPPGLGPGFFQLAANGWTGLYNALVANLRDWRSQLEGMTRVQLLVHLAKRYDQVEQDAIKGSLLPAMRAFYEDELNIQAAKVGCPGRRAHVSSGQILSQINSVAEAHAASITATYNWDLANAIKAITAEVPTANRHVYAKRLTEWETARASWKNEQIALMTEQTVRAMALQDFYRQNGAGIGRAMLMPRTAVCPICQGWIDRGWVPLAEAIRHPPPYHVNCPHNWFTKPDKVPRSQCPTLWMGE